MKLFLLMALLSSLGAIASADSIWVSSKDLSIIEKSKNLLVMRLDGTEEKNFLKSSATCNLEYQSKNYDRVIKNGSQFKLVSIYEVPWHKPTFEEAVNDAKTYMDLDVQFKAKNMKELIEELRLNYNVEFDPNNGGKNETVYLLKLKSMKSETEYGMKCFIGKGHVSADELTDLLAHYGDISPSTDL